MLQVRMPVDDLPLVVKKLVNGKLSWEEVLNTYPRFEQQEATKKWESDFLRINDEI